MAVSKPLPGTPIDPTNPWARGLVNAMLGNQSGQRVINHAPNFNGIDGAGTALQLVGSPGGGAIKGNGTSAYANYGNQTRMRGTGAFTVAFRALFKTVTPGNFPTIYSSGYDGSNASLQVGFNFASAGNGKLWVAGKAVGLIGAFTTQDFSSYLNQWFDFIVDYDGLGTNGYTITVNGVPDFTTSGSGARAANGRNVYLGGLDFNGTPSRFFDGSIDYLYHWEGRTFSAAEKKALRANPWQLWPDEPQLVFAPVTTFTGTATTSQAQTAAATGLAGNIGTATSSQAQTAAATGLSGYIGTATASQAQTANATGLAGVIGNATSSQAQSATGAGAETYNGNATSSQAQTAAAVGLAGVIGTVTASQAQTSDAIGVAGIVGTATSSQAQTVNGAGNNGQLSVQFGGHIAQPQYIHVPMFARGTGKATCKSKPHVRVLTRALAIGRSKGTCRPLARQFMAGRAVGASVPVISSMRLQYNETWHAQRARDDQSLLFGF